ncbi:hypothetical protein F5Y06DRAFT_20075 [Hypoxylon sp. FL0890]|nr:hypothetical protein F5Y06DRAFT_20075 [Hypoxylon sp. FL0890]
MATRIFVSVSSTSSHFEKAWDSPEIIIQFALDLIKRCNLVSYEKPPNPQFLAKERWHRIHIVFDIFNDKYDSTTAHLPNQNDLPVIAVYLGGNSNSANIALKGIKDQVNEEIRNLHDWNGHGSQPPFAVDHANGNVPTYPNPRTLIRANLNGEKM